MRAWAARVVGCMDAPTGLQLDQATAASGIMWCLEFDPEDDHEARTMEPLDWWCRRGCNATWAGLPHRAPPRTRIRIGSAHAIAWWVLLVVSAAIDDSGLDPDLPVQPTAGEGGKGVLAGAGRSPTKGLVARAPPNAHPGTCCTGFRLLTINRPCLPAWCATMRHVHHQRPSLTRRALPTRLCCQTRWVR